MSSRAIRIDSCLAVAIAIALLILTPGLGTLALIAILTVIVCVSSFAIEWLVRRRRQRRRETPGRE